MLTTILAGCGVQGEPLPPLLNVPMPAEARAVQRGSRALVSWTLPANTTEGQAIRPDRLGGVEVYRAVLPGLRADVMAQEFEAQAQRVATLPPLSDSYAEDLPLSRAGSTLAYAVRLLNRRGDSAGFSNIAAVPALAAPAAPSAPVLKPTEQAILVEWPAVPSASGYHVYRAQNKEDKAGKEDKADYRLAGETSTASYSDRAVEIGREYSYLVRAFTAQGDFRAESTDSPRVAIRREDIFPPAVPANLAVVPAGGAQPMIELSWDPNAEADLAGYNLFRSDDGAAPRRIHNELLVSPAFRDTAVRPAIRYTYVVSAVDQKGNESARSQPVTVTIAP